MPENRLTLPVDDGTSGQVLSTDGSGALSWAADASGGASYKEEGTDFTSSIIVGHSTTGTLSAAQRNTAFGLAAMDAHNRRCVEKYLTIKFSVLNALKQSMRKISHVIVFLVRRRISLPCLVETRQPFFTRL